MIRSGNKNPEMIKVLLAQKKMRMQRNKISLFQGVYFYMHDSCESGVVTPLTEKIKLQKLFSEKRLTSEKLITRRILQYHVIYLRMSDALLCPLVFDFLWSVRTLEFVSASISLNAKHVRPLEI